MISDLTERAWNARPTSTGSGVDVWMLSRRNFALHHEAFLNILDTDEQSRAQSFRAERHQRDFVTARGLLRILLAGYCHCDPKQVKFSYGLHGKPALAMPRVRTNDLGFNMSHSEDAVLVALTSGADVGIDVEQCESGTVHSEVIASSCLSEKESLHLEHLAPRRRPQTLLRFWTHKEACLKAIGCGLSLPPRALTVDFLDASRSVIRRTNPGEQQSFFGYDLPCGKSYAGAMVGTTPISEWRFFRI